jgi:phosphohistidine phosphatase SixA
VKDGQLGAKIALCGHLPFLNKLAGHVLCDDSKLCPIALSNCGPACLEKEEKTGKWQLKWLLPLTALPEFFEP